MSPITWSDPTGTISRKACGPNARGPGLVTFGPDRVKQFCENNGLQMIVRAHECVVDGFERFAQGQLLTLFSATTAAGRQQRGCNFSFRTRFNALPETHPPVATGSDGFGFSRRIRPRVVDARNHPRTSRRRCRGKIAFSVTNS